jgi:hypothetical protein
MVTYFGHIAGRSFRKLCRFARSAAIPSSLSRKILAKVTAHLYRLIHNKVQVFLADIVKLLTC